MYTTGYRAIAWEVPWDILASNPKGIRKCSWTFHVNQTGNKPLGTDMNLLFLNVNQTASQSLDNFYESLPAGTVTSTVYW